jgi:pyrroline-5-carboxylate reductase
VYIGFGTISGSVKTASLSNASLEELRNSVTSKHGTTHAGLEQLMRGDQLDALFHDIVQAAYVSADALKLHAPCRVKN